MRAIKKEVKVRNIEYLDIHIGGVNPRILSSYEN